MKLEIKSDEIKEVKSLGIVFFQIFANVLFP